MSGDEYDYHRAYPVIELPERGHVPAACTTEKLTALEFDERVAALENLSNEIWSLPRNATQRRPSVEIREDEIARAG
jgi:hypothetical protein